jgi:hypothetical protein
VWQLNHPLIRKLRSVRSGRRQHFVLLRTWKKRNLKRIRFSSFSPFFSHSNRMYVHISQKTLIHKLSSWTSWAGWLNSTNFCHLGDCLLWVLIDEITKLARKLGLLFHSKCHVCIYLLRRNEGWATFWAFYSQRHLVTLVARHFATSAPIWILSVCENVEVTCFKY